MLRILEGIEIWRFPKIRAPFLGVPIIRITVYWGIRYTSESPQVKEATRCVGLSSSHISQTLNPRLTDFAKEQVNVAGEKTPA